MIYTHNLSPIMLDLFGLKIRYYSLAYMLGFLFAYFIIKKAYKRDSKLNMDKHKLDELLFYGILSIIIGGRLGYILFYNFSFFLENPLQLFAIWNGGMSFHGAAFGGFVGIFLFARKFKVPFLKLLDVIVYSAPIGLFFGRVANFINGELWGRPVNGAEWGIIFPRKDFLPRHPSQLYEAALEGVALFIILYIFMKLKTLGKLKVKDGFIAGTGMIGYAIARMIIENFREPDAQLGFIFKHITMGQLLSIPVILVGGILIYKSVKKSK